MKKFTAILLSIIIFNFTQAQKLKKLGIEFESVSYNFGDIQMWENQPAIYTLTNKSKHPISILPLFSENDLEIIYPERSIQPGETAIIKAIYYTGGTGSFSRKFPIYFNTSPEAYDLKITGNIKSLSPTAYIQCPQSKPEHSKPKMELFGNVAEIESLIPLSGSEVKIISLSSKNNLTFYADKNGNFGSNLPSGNYEVIVHHPNYVPHQSFFFLGQTSGHLKIRLTPIPEEPVLANNTPLPKKNPNELDKKQGELHSENTINNPEKVKSPAVNNNTPPPNLDEEKIDSKQASSNKDLNNTSPKKVNTFEVTDDIPYPNQYSTKEIDKKALEPQQNDVQPTFNSKKQDEEIVQENYAYNPEPIETKQENTYNNQPRETYQYDPQKDYNYTIPKESSYTNPPREEYKYDPKKDYNYTGTKEPTYEANKPSVKPVEIPTIKTKKYTVRIIDEKTLEPIENANIFASPALDKAKTIKLKSDNSGMAHLPLEKDDYKLIVNADNYISGEAKIKANQDDEIIRVYLSPVSNLFDDIYAAKKKDSGTDDLLSQLSFGKTDYNLKDNETPIKEVPTTTEKVTETPATIQEQPIIGEVEYNEQIPEKEIPITVGKSTEAPSTPALVKKEINIDSIQRVLADIEAEKLQIELALAKKELELSKKETLLAQQESELAKKDAELGSKNNQLEQVKTNYNESQDELEKQKKALEEITIKEAKKEKDTPISLELSKDDYAANNVLFLIDISSSMGKENKMELLKESIKSLALVLRDIDRVAIIAYNQNATVVLESVSGADKGLIINAVDSLQTSGLTYGVNGLQTAYDLLEYNYIGSGNNQIILATDGLFSSVNNNMTENELNKEVRKQVNENNIKLSVIGFGQDENGEKLMEKLAGNGEGKFIKIKNPWQAKTVLVDEIKENSKLQ